jgi:hypothetical protein
MQYLNFIETYFGVSPDNGDGSLEIMALVLLVALAALIGMLLPMDAKPEDKASPD